MSGRLGLAIGLVLLLIALGIGHVLGARPGEHEVTYTDLVRLAQAGQATAVEIEGRRFVVRQAGRDPVTSVVDDATLRHELVSRFAEAGVPVSFAALDDVGLRGVSAAFPLVLMGALGLAFVVVRRRRGQRSFAEIKAGLARAQVRFVDVAGVEEVKRELVETVEFLRSPERFARLGGRAPRGVLMTGEPGTGKTLLARAVASEAGVPFLSASGSSFQEMFVGVGASRVRTLFAEARKVAPCIVFIDEIDAVGRARARHGDSASAEHDQTLNQLLVEMDGFDHTTGIVVIASTNRVDMLDPALLRPGRFDRKIVVPLPDVRGREEILAVHAGPIALGGQVDLGLLARGTPGFSGADLANLLNEAAILAAREGADAVDPSHLERARDRVILGLERKGALVDEDERYATAVHEAGHVTVGLLAPSCDPVYKVSILPRGRALGVTHSLPERDRLMYRKEYLEDQICMLMGGRAAEMVILGTMTAGASDDIQRAGAIAFKMVSELGMSDLGPIHLGDGRGPRSQALRDRVDEATRTLTEAQLVRAVEMVKSHRDQIGSLVRSLLEKETLGSEEIQSCFPADRRRRDAATA